MKNEVFQPRLLYSAKLSFIVKEEIKSLCDKQKFKQLMMTKPVLQNILKGSWVPIANAYILATLEAEIRRLVVCR
jgi:hypothetical protein